MKTRVVLLCILILCVLPFLSNPQTTPTTEGASTAIENNQFTPSVAGDDYVDSRYSITYGTSTTDPPAGMGNVDAATTNMTEGTIGDQLVLGQSGAYSNLVTEAANYLTGSVFTTGSEGGTVADAHFYGRGTTSGNGKIVIVGHTAMTIITNGVSNPVAFTTTTDWYTVTWTTAPTLAASTAYVLMLITDVSFRLYYYDTSALGHQDTTNSYTTPTDPTDYSHQNYQWLIYTHYTPVRYGFEAIFAFASVDYNTYASEVLWFDFDAASTAETVSIYGGTTTSPSTLLASLKNTDFSVDIHATLTGASYYIKIIDDVRTSDTDSDVWKIVKCYITLTNAVPVNDVAASCTNIDDTNDIYAQYRWYTFSVSTQDPDGFAHIDYIELSGISTAGGTVIWCLRYDEDTGVFTEEGYVTAIELSSSYSSATKSTINCDVIFTFKTDFYYPAEGADPAFGCPDVRAYDLKQYVCDADGASDTDTYNVDYDYHTRLSSTLSLTDGVGITTQGSINGAITASGVCSYVDESSRHPYGNETDLEVGNPMVAGSPWSVGTYTDATGAWSQTVYADDVVSYSSYALNALKVGHTKSIGSSGSVAYIADKVTVKTTTSSDLDGRVNAGGNVEVRVTAWSEYNDTYLASGDSVSLNGSAMSWDAGNAWWELTVTKATVCTWKYIVSAVSETYYGITALDTDSKSVTIIYEKVNIDYSITRSWTVIGYSVTVSVTATYMSDSGAFGGTVNHNFAIGSITLGSVGSRTWFPNSITDPTYGITVFQNDSVSCIWDDAIPVSTPTYSWMQYDIDTVWLIWGTVSTWEWDFNGSYLAQGINLVGHANASEKARSAIWSATGNFGGLSIGEFNPSWYFVNISINVETTVNGQSYDWIVWTVIISVDITHTLQLVGPSVDVQDVWITFYYTTNYGNACLTVWDNNTLVGYSQWEGAYQIAKPTIIGLHNYTLLYNSSHAGAGYTDQTKNFVDNDLWLWQNWKYTVNPVQLSFTEISFEQNNESVQIGGFVWTSANHIHWTVYEANLGWTSGIYSGITSADHISWMWDKSSTTSTSNYTVYVSDGSYNVTFRGFYLKIAGNQWITYGSSVTEDHRTYIQNSSIIYNNPPGFFIDQGTATILAVGGVIIAMFALMVSKQIVKGEILKGIRKGLSQ